MPVDGDDRLRAAIARLRPQVRGERPYLVGGMEQPAIKLNQNESPFDIPPDVKRKLVERFLEIPANRYPREQPWALRDKLAGVLDLPPEMIIVGNGSNEMSHTLALLTVDEGTPVVLPRPMFALYESVIRMFGGRPVTVAPREDLGFDVAGLLKAVERENPPLTILTSPNNPTGLALRFADVEEIVSRSKGLVVVDEAYWEFNEEPAATTLLDRYPNLLVVRTFSKAVGLAGLRLGYLVGHRDIIAEIMKVRLPFMVDRFAEEVGLALLERPQLIATRVEQIKDGLAELREALEALEGVTVLPSSANFVLFKTPQEPAEVMSRLASAGVLVRNMAGYPELRGYLRVNAGTPDENKAFLAALNRAVFA